MKNLLRLIAFFLLSFGLGACAESSIAQGGANVTVMGANYTSDHIDFTLMSPSGKNLGIGENVKPFSKGGSGGWSCCSMVPGVGQTVRVESKVGGFNDAADQYKTYKRDVVVTGSMPSTKDELHGYLIVRFFPGNQVEVELIPSADFAPQNPHVDKLFSGNRVIRKIGE
jgi:hypothetical protein